MTVSDIEDNMSHKEFIEWQAYNKYIEPVGNEFIDNQFATLRRSNYGGEEQVTIDDFKMYKNAYDMKTEEEIEEEYLELERQKAIINKEALQEFFRSKVVKTD